MIVAKPIDCLRQDNNRFRDEAKNAVVPLPALLWREMFKYNGKAF